MIVDTEKQLHRIAPGKKIEGDWFGGIIPINAKVGENCYIDTTATFKQFFSKLPTGLAIGDHVTIKNASLATEENAVIEIGDYTYIYNAALVCSEKISIGSHVCISGGVNIVDTDFHPLDPEQRIADTMALSPVGNKQLRPTFSSKPVVIEDEVWIGYNATILKGVRIGRRAIIQPGSVVSKDVPEGAIVSGNPAQHLNESNE